MLHFRDCAQPARGHVSMRGLCVSLLNLFGAQAG